MNIRYIILIILSILFWRHGHTQYPAAGTKQRLGYQTTGDGLVFRGNGAPTYTPTGLNNAWMYIDTLTRNLYAFTSGTWQLVSGGGSAFDGHVDSLVFNTNVTVIDSTAKMYWDANSETISVGVDGGAVYQLGEELFYPLVINKSGATILNGQLVMVDTATLVTGDHVRIILARNGATYPSNYIMGVATTDIPNDSTGLVTWFGYVREVKHADIAQTGITLVPGNILYASATEPGRYTNVAPTTPAHKSTIALVVRKPSDNNMTLLVRPWLAPRLADLSDVNTSSVTGLSVLRYNSTTGIWDASATPGIVAADTASMLSPYLRKVDTTAMLLPYLRKADTTAMLSPYLRKVDTLSLSNRINLKLNIADTTAMLAPYAKGSSTAGRVAYWNGTRDLTGSANLTWTEANKTLGINTTTTSGANLIIKNSQEPTRTTVVATQTFGADTTNWTRGSGWTFNGTQAVATAATGNLTYVGGLTLVAGRAYEITYTMSDYSAGDAWMRCGNSGIYLTRLDIGNNKVVLRPISSLTDGFRIQGVTFTGRIDNISIVEIANPLLFQSATQNATDATLYNQVAVNTTSFYMGGGGKLSTLGGNLAQGSNALLNNTAGTNIIAQGFEAAINNITGSNFVAQGYRAAYSNTIGTSFIAQGYNAAYNCVSCINYIAQGSDAGFGVKISGNWIAQGVEAGYTGTSGGSWIAQGYRAGYSNASGGGWIAQGFESGYSNVSGTGWFAQGFRAGYGNVSGNYWSAAGVEAAYNAKGSNFTAIGYQSGRSYSNGSDAGDFTNSVYVGALTRVGGTSGQRTNENVFGYAAIGNGDNTVTLGNSSILKHYFSGTRQINLPSGTTANRGTGLAGDLRYNTDSTKVEFYNGTTWSGLQSTITSPVTGTGAAGQVAYWSGTGAQTGSANFTWDNTKGQAVITNLETITTAYGLRVHGSSSIGWNGRIIAGGNTAVFLMGEYQNKAWFGAHNAALNAWENIYLNPDGAKTAYIGSSNLAVFNNSSSRIGIKRALPDYTLDINATDAIRIPVGTTAQQPTGAAGVVRYNSTNTALEYHNGTAWKTVANTDNTVQTFNFSINIYNASDTVKNITSPANFFLVPANLNGYCIDSYQVKALSGTGTADIQLAKNGTGGNVQAISGTTAYNKDTNVTLATGDVIQGQVFNLSAGATLVGLGFTIEIKATCN